MADPRDRRSPAARKATAERMATVKASPRAESTAYRESKGYKLFVSRKMQLIVGILCVLVGALCAVDYWGPRSMSIETVQGFPNAGNYKLIRTDKSFFPIAYEIRSSTVELGHQQLEVYKSLSGAPLAFAAPNAFPGKIYEPLSTRYDYIVLQLFCLVMGFVLIFHRKQDDTRVLIVVVAVISIVAAVIPIIGYELTIKKIAETKTMYW